MPNARPRAVVLLSGGLDSSTCLAWAAAQYDCYALSFIYGQRSSSELQAAGRLAKQFAVEHRIINIDLGTIGGSSLTDHNLQVPEQAQDGIPSTYVPARNTIFLSYAMALAEVKQAQTIVIGVNAVDYSGYPDCRPEYIEAFSNMANLATKAAVEGEKLTIATPLLHLSKAKIIQLGLAHGLDYANTVSCYQADIEGRACGKCDSCRLRKQGFEDAGVADPTRYYTH
ncbi:MULTISPECIES: 7-cyano-7-deazaguanine synthase QueC [unclassified Acinetobacter]|uniref:7-cyano-7-deazaguanine synthase QueC n=1 Tax=unclassified Acinetobacter TaxID=196816 RepID=UPI0035B87CDA